MYSDFYRDRRTFINCLSQELLSEKCVESQFKILHSKISSCLAPSGSQGMLICVSLSSSNFSGALNLQLSAAKVFKLPFIESLSGLCAYFVGKTEPKILHLVNKIWVLTLCPHPGPALALALAFWLCCNLCLAQGSGPPLPCSAWEMH